MKQLLLFFFGPFFLSQLSFAQVVTQIQFEQSNDLQFKVEIHNKLINVQNVSLIIIKYLFIRIYFSIQLFNLFR